MEVAIAIALAAFVGGVVFMLLDNWQRKQVTAAAPVTAEPQAAAPIWTPSGSGGWSPPSYERPAPPQPPVWTPSEDRTPPLPPSRWQPASEERTEPLPPQAPAWSPAAEERTEPRPLWTPPSSPGSTSRWDDDDRRRDHDDEDDPPPGLWSGWARR
jgi:hypothetical protein